MIDCCKVLFSFTDKILRSDGIVPIENAVQELVIELGFLYVTCATVRQFQGVFLHESNFQTWPAAAARQFISSDLFRHDPIIMRSRQESTAFFWQFDAYNLSDPHHAEILAIRTAAGVTGGCCAPVPERVGGQTAGRLVLYVTGRGFDQSREIRLTLQLAAAQVAARLADVKSSIVPNMNDADTRFFDTTGLLSSRERTILSWVASGKSSWEIGQILKISEHTVNTHIEKALVKFGAANRTEAVVKAMILDELRLNPE